MPVTSVTTDPEALTLDGAIAHDMSRSAIS